MNLFINSPAHFTQEYGINEEIYNMCHKISENIDIKSYTEYLDTIGIIPMIAPIESLTLANWKEIKYISLPYRMASISLSCDYKDYVNGDIERKKQIVVENILQSLKCVKKRLKEKFDYEQLEKDIKELID